MPKSGISVHRFPECKELWEELDAAGKAAAIQLAYLVWNAPGHKVPEHVPDELIEELQKADIVDQEDGGWRLVPAEILFFLRAIDLIDSLALSSLEAEQVLQELEGLVELAAADRNPVRAVRDYRELLSFIVAQLVNGFGREDILATAISDKVQGTRFWDAYDAICCSLPILDAGVQTTVQFLRSAEERARGDLACGRVYQAAEYLGLFRPDSAFEVVDYLVESADQVTAGFLERLFTGIAKSSPENLDVVATKCEVWLESDEQALCQAAICCSQNLILNDGFDPDYLLSRFDSLAAKSDSVRYTLSIAVATLGANFEERSQECLSMLQRLKAAGPLDGVTYGIAHALSRVKDEMAIDYRVSCLTLLEDVPEDNKATIERIRRILQRIVLSLPAEVWGYLRRWIVSHDGEGSIAEHDMFLHTIQDAHQHDPALGSRVLTHWFSAPDLRLVEEARAIMAELGICAFDAEAVEGMSAPVIDYLTQKLLVGHFEPVQLMRLFHSILVNAPEVGELREYFATSLWYLAWNYPGAAQSLFDQSVDEHDTSISNAILVEVRDQLEEYRRRRKGVFTPELSSSKRRLEKYYQLEGKKMQVVQEAMLENDRFPLQKLFSRVSIARGDRTFHMKVFHPDPSRRRTFTEPRGFSKVSQSIELPRGEIIDPEGEALLRMVRLSRTIGESQEDESP